MAIKRQAKIAIWMRGRASGGNNELDHCGPLVPDDSRCQIHFVSACISRDAANVPEMSCQEEGKVFF